MTDMVEFAAWVSPEPDDDGFEATPSLRLVGARKRLQQRWRKPKLDGWGHLNGWEYEWRDVPNVYDVD